MQEIAHEIPGGDVNHQSGNNEKNPFEFKQQQPKIGKYRDMIFKIHKS